MVLIGQFSTPSGVKTKKPNQAIQKNWSMLKPQLRCLTTWILIRNINSRMTTFFSASLTLSRRSGTIHSWERDREKRMDHSAITHGKLGEKSMRSTRLSLKVPSLLISAQSLMELMKMANNGDSVVSGPRIDGSGTPQCFL